MALMIILLITNQATIYIAIVAIRCSQSREKVQTTGTTTGFELNTKNKKKTVCGQKLPRVYLYIFFSCQKILPRTQM